MLADIKSKKRTLVRALLLSSLMVAPNVQALPLIINGINLVGLVPVIPPLTTTLLELLFTFDDIQISSIGQLSGSATALNLNDTRNVQILAANLFGNAIDVSGVGNGLQFSPGSNNSTVSIGSASNLVTSGTGSAIVIDSLLTGIGITNSGKIQSASGSAIASSGAIATFVNNATGTITSSGASAMNLATGSSLPGLNNQGIISTTSVSPTVNAINSLGNITGAINNSGSITASSGTALALLASTVSLPSLTNSGTISSGNTGSGILSNIAITGNLTNAVSGIISSTAGNAINLAAGSLGGSLLNSGTISSNGAGSAIVSNIPIAGNIANNAGAFITSTNGSALTLNNTSSMVDLNNLGTISTTANVATINAINSLGNITGAITNGGSITAVSGTALALLGSSLPLGSITNSGTISSNGTGSGIESKIPITGNITNDATKLIYSASGTGLNLSAGSLGGSLINNGTIESNGAGSGVSSAVAMVGNITNSSTGSILSNTGTGLNLANTASLVNLTNQGIISTNSVTPTVNAISSLGNITGAISNTGSITAATGTALALLGSTLPVGSITNSGIISSGGSGSGIESKVPITGNITNDATKMISSVSGSGLNLSQGSLGGSLLNNGTIQSTNGTGLSSAIAMVGGITNSATGSILSTSGTGLNLASGSSIANLANLGNISTNSATNSINAINLGGTVAGDISNSGSILANAGRAINLVGATVEGSLNNSSLITTAGFQPAIVLDELSNIKGGIINTGTITSTLGSTALDLSASKNGVNFINNALGTVTGDLKLSQAAQALDPVLEMNGGTITGIVRAASGLNPSTLNITGGSLPLGIILSNKADVINQSGGQIGDIIGTANSNQLLNIVGSVVTGGTISNVDNILVNTGAQLTVDDAISGLKTLTLKQNPIGLPNVIQNLDFITNPGTILDVELKDVNNFGHMILNGANNVLNDTTLKVTLAPGNLINVADEFKVIDGLLNPITGTLNLILPESATLTFSLKDAIDGILDLNSIILIASRLYQDPLNIPGIGQVLLDLLNSLGIGLTINSDLLGLGAALDNLTSAEALSNSLESLAPPHNGGMPDLAQRTFKNVLNGIFDHLYYADCTRPYWGRDSERYPAGAWTRVFGDYAHQEHDSQNRSYNARAGGVILGYDLYHNKHSTLGAALSYSAGDVNTDIPAYQKQKLWSYQLSGYLTHDIGCRAPLYVDLMAAVAYDAFDSRREIVAGPVEYRTHASFNGWHYGAALESGYRLLLGKALQYQFIPLVKLRYSNLDINDYSEAGSGLALAIENDNIGEFTTGAGFKFKRVNKHLVPEFRFNVLYDWIADPQTTTAAFLVGGDSFVTQGADVEALTYNVGVSIGGELKKDLILYLSYDADLKNHYVAQTGSIKFKYEW